MKIKKLLKKIYDFFYLVGDILYTACWFLTIILLVVILFHIKEFLGSGAEQTLKQIFV
jgi:hypothetical protein